MSARQRYSSPKVGAPAYDQCPMNGRERYLAQMQRLLLSTPDNQIIRNRYYEALVGPVPSEKKLPLETVVAMNFEAVRRQALREHLVCYWGTPIVNFLFWIGWYK